MVIIEPDIRIIMFTYYGSMEIFYLVVTTLFNAAPGQAGLKDDFFTNTDILCVNETEVRITLWILKV